MRRSIAPSERVPREKILAFLRGGVDLMRSDETRRQLRELRGSQGRPAQKLIELQRSVWDGLGVDRHLGCECVDASGELYPGDGEILSAGMEFMQQARVTYLMALEDLRPEKLQGSGSMTREQLIGFCEACEAKLHMPEVAQQLRDEIDKTGEIPNRFFVELQKATVEVLGFEREHGFACIESFLKDHPRDVEIRDRAEKIRQLGVRMRGAVVDQYEKETQKKVILPGALRDVEPGWVGADVMIMPLFCLFLGSFVPWVFQVLPFIEAIVVCATTSSLSLCVARRARRARFGRWFPSIARRLQKGVAGEKAA